VKKILRFLQWSLKAAIFFTLFAFALNNPGDITLHFFFGTQWTGPLVLMVLGVFTLGVIVGVLGMLPKWWRHRRALQRMQNAQSQPSQTSAPSYTAGTEVSRDPSSDLSHQAIAFKADAISGAPHGI
jgi:uncharacterized integral membrane protein